MNVPLYYKELIIPSTIEGVDSCLVLVNQISTLFKLDLELLFSLQTLILESVENAIYHGNHGNRDLFVYVSFEVTEFEIIIKVEDQGMGFDIDMVPSPLLQANIRKESGRGIFFIKNLSSSCYTLGSGNILIMKINR